MKATIAGIIVASLLFVGGYALLRTKSAAAPVAAAKGSNVEVVNGTQIITIKAKGGYVPERSTAKAGVPTIIRFETNGNFDCSSEVRIPSLGVSKNLPPIGKTDVAVGELKPGLVQGTCGMGMYRFQVDVQS